MTKTIDFYVDFEVEEGLLKVDLGEEELRFPFDGIATAITFGNGKPGPEDVAKVYWKVRLEGSLEGLVITSEQEAVHVRLLNPKEAAFLTSEMLEVGAI